MNTSTKELRGSDKILDVLLAGWVAGGGGGRRGGVGRVRVLYRYLPSSPLTCQCSSVTTMATAGPVLVEVG